MKSSIKFKPTTSSLLVRFAFCCFAFFPLAQAVLPPPDGGYPAFNTAEGQNALLNLTIGTANTAVGWSSLLTNAEGSFNTATGAGALLFNNGDASVGEASQNSAFGTAALLFNTTGARNTAVGSAALLNNTIGSGNTANGVQALLSNTTGNENTAIGDEALLANTSSRNTAIGFGALPHNPTGSDNTAIGYQALFGNTVGNGNIALGADAGSLVGEASNVICIGAPGLPGVSDSCFIGNIFNTDLPGGNAVFINSNGRLGLMLSSQRFKDRIEPMKQASEALFSLKPVTFRYKKEIDPHGIPHFGLVAEEVEKVNPDLITRDREGKPYTVRYEQINVMLLNEFLKEHRKVQDLEATVTHQQNQIQALVTNLQKVNARVDAIPVPRLVASKP